MDGDVPIFRFRRYREEVARRAAMQKRDGTENDNEASNDAAIANATAANDSIRAKANSSTVTDIDSSDSDDDDDEATIQNLSDVSIVIDLHGKVVMEKKTGDTKITKTDDQSDSSAPLKSSGTDTNKHQKPICDVSEGATLLLRNLRNCHVIIHLPLPAIHFVGIENTEIIFYNKGDENTDDNTYVNTTIHMTDCRGESSLQLQKSAQQLRIHRSNGLRVEMMNEKVLKTNSKNYHDESGSSASMPSNWKPGSVILEASENIVFSVPPIAEETPVNQSHEKEDKELSLLRTVSATKSYWQQIVVKDFQWLRKGIASPNFRIEVFTVNNDGFENDKNSMKDLTKTLETTKLTKPEKESSVEELVHENSSDSEDEL